MADTEKGEHRYEEKHDGCPGRAVAHAESDALVVDADDVEPRGEFDGAKAIAWFRKIQHDPPLADLVQHVERQGDPAKKLAEGEVHGGVDYQSFFNKK